MIQTVSGKISPMEMGRTLPHEHILVDFIGADQSGTHRYDKEDVVQVMLPYLQELQTYDVSTFVDCTPAYLGRDVDLLQMLGDQSGLQIITNTGLYARQNFLPKETYDKTAGELADEWIAEFREGINQTTIKPGFIKTAVEGGALRDIEKKTLEAAAITSVETGLTIATHTGHGDTALEILDLLTEFGVDARKWIFVHAHVEEDLEKIHEVANHGAWIELDGLAWTSERAKHYKYTKFLVSKGFQDQLLLSHDAGWYHVGEERGGDQIPYTYLFTDFIPNLMEEGIVQDQLDKITSENPASAYRIG